MDKYYRVENIYRIYKLSKSQTAPQKVVEGALEMMYYYGVGEGCRMPLVQVLFPTDATKERQSVVRMATPKKVGDILQWFKDARRVAPQIPNPDHGLGWKIVKMEADLREVRFLLQDSVNQQCLVVIDRQTRI